MQAPQLVEAANKTAALDPQRVVEAKLAHTVTEVDGVTVGGIC